MATGDRTALRLEFRNRILAIHGEAGKTWLAAFPDLIRDIENEWSITAAPTPFNLTFNFVTTATDDTGTEFVLKLGVPNRELRSEIGALRLFAGIGYAQVFKADADRGAMLLERLSPGIPLKSLAADDERATSIASQLIAKLQRSRFDARGFTTLENWSLGFDRLLASYGGSTGPFDKNLVLSAKQMFAELTRSAEKQILLHGDLHHDNILSHQSSWRAIDPKGVIGDPVYEVGPLIRNPVPEIYANPDIKSLLQRRIQQFSDELGFDKKRVWGWAFSQSVLSAWWSREDEGGGWERPMELAAKIYELRNTR